MSVELPVRDVDQGARVMSFDASVDALLALLAGVERVLVVAHERPDGDAVGSALAAYHLLSAMGKQVRVYNEDAIPYNFTFLPGADQWQTSLDEATLDHQLLILLDCAERHRAGARLAPRAWACEHVVVIDHHKSYDPTLAHLYVRDAAACATGAVLYRIATRAQVSMSLALAQCLYCCVMTDTGGFRYASTTPEAMRIAAALLEAGVEPWPMTSRIYEDQPVARLQLLSRVLQTLTLSPCGRLAFLRIDDATLASVGAPLELAEGFINYARGVRGVELATQLREDGPNRWRVSFRSRGVVDASALAERFGGGGHHNAAACVMEGAPDEVEARLSAALVALLDAGGA